LAQFSGGEAFARKKPYCSGICPPGSKALLERMKGSGVGVGVAVGMGVGVCVGVGVDVDVGTGVCVGVGAWVGAGVRVGVGVGGVNTPLPPITMMPNTTTTAVTRATMGSGISSSFFISSPDA
jgi:hypothetical protein